MPIPTLDLAGLKLKELPPNKNDKVYFELETNTVNIGGQLCRVFVADKYETDSMGRSIKMSVLRFLRLDATVPKETFKTAEVKKNDKPQKEAAKATDAEMAEFKEFMAFKAMKAKLG